MNKSAIHSANTSNSSLSTMPLERKKSSKVLQLNHTTEVQPKPKPAQQTDNFLDFRCEFDLPKFCDLTVNRDSKFSLQTAPDSLTPRANPLCQHGFEWF